MIMEVTVQKASDLFYQVIIHISYFSDNKYPLRDIYYRK
jgi:hypothetical protein